MERAAKPARANYQSATWRLRQARTVARGMGPPTFTATCVAQQFDHAARRRGETELNPRNQRFPRRGGPTGPSTLVGSLMTTIILVVLIILLLGGGGYGYSRYGAGGGFGIGGVLLLLLILFLVFGYR